MAPESSAIGKPRRRSCLAKLVTASRRRIRLLHPRWKAVLYTALTVLALSVLTLALFFRAEGTWSSEANPHPTVFPYLAAAVLFFSSCVWVLFEGRATALAAIKRKDSGRSAVFASVTVFVTLLLALLVWGMAGPEADNTISKMNCYLFQDHDNGCRRLGRYQQVFNYLAAAGNAAAISVVTYLGIKCFEITTAATQAHISLRACTRAMSELLVLASTVFVTAMLALYLLFMAGSELAPNPPGDSEPAISSAQRSMEKAKHTATAINCTGVPATSLQCVVTATTASPANAKRPIAPTMAFVAGLSFTGALFFLFMTAGSALDDAVQKRLDAARSAFPKPSRFNTKAWLEQEGLLESSKDLLLKGLALLAPAATGAITLFSGA